MAPRKQKPWTVKNIMIMPDGSHLLMSMIENALSPDRKITVFITEEQRREFERQMMENTSRAMSPYYDEDGKYCPNGKYGEK